MQTIESSRRACDHDHARAFAGNAALMLRAVGVGKTFTLHAHGGMTIDALENVSLDVEAGECVALTGPSGAGKSTLLRCLYGNYLANRGTIAVRVGTRAAEHVVLTASEPHEVIALRRDVIGYVSQFLRAIPRVPALALVAAPLVARGMPEGEAADRAAHLLARLNVPRRLWTLAPATFSGGEQQRVNIARGLIAEHPVLLLDEPTASLDAENRDVVAELIGDVRRRGAAIVGIFHDEATRERVATRCFPLRPPSRARLPFDEVNA
ncbi:phosphonate C-P lyase system protein PhnL [Burkholderia pseudomallei]|uniref:phosphonate C-P lyase system protein PhnL n=1 Tax=Burkholderia pseudomallei TaxID=28450 RepID=UPI00018A4EA0|nr:phosphonate C-P lyase system protein PhnL [Burkholderia pseudomallei]EEC35773.1 phosphonate C-P lyase system protein PhnL [Burkholderia pseudomallei 576]OMR27160.1 phosphonate C-P lyase system protein PhnL [Burkholderia pseudomallei]CAJ4515200.1 phosphonate C-P lyase system protein PhnL [Burkholderia pseudomallei]VBQ25540.1 phosphonate C-P lyase system protein PhnL [Burkholderia pseudomallei]